MPWERERYPHDWSAISLVIKDSADWCCQVCGKACRKPSEKRSEFIRRVFPDFQSNAWCEAVDHPQRFTLTVGHLDQNPQNNHPDNLKAMCTPCHLQHDRQFQAHNRAAKRERRGQTNLFHPPLDQEVI